MIYLSFAASALVAFLAFFWLEPTDWASVRGPLLVAFGIQAAALLTRLGRGHPVGDTSHLTTEQIERLNEAVLKIASEQAKAVRISMCALVGVITVSGAHQIIAWSANFIGQLLPAISSAAANGGNTIIQLLTGLVVFLVGAALTHLPAVVSQDIGLIRLQAQFKKEALKAAAEKSAREKAEREQHRLLLSEILRAVSDRDKLHEGFGTVVGRDK